VSSLIEGSASADSCPSPTGSSDLGIVIRGEGPACPQYPGPTPAPGTQCTRRFHRRTSTESHARLTSHFGGWTEKPDRRSMRMPMSNTPHTYLTTAEVADVFQDSPKTVTRWAREGKVPHSRTLGGHRRYPGDPIRKLATELFRSDGGFVPRG
jgi:excisionase family DNA binding protein